jgi:hypothetical protein
MTSIVVRILCCGVSQKQKDAAQIGRKVLIEIICFTLKKKAALLWTAFSIV